MISLLIPDMPQADEILPYLRQIDANRHYTNYGPLNQELESRLASYLLSQVNEEAFVPDTLHVTTVANATLGLEVICAALDIPKQANVLMPALTFPATATAVIRQGLAPLFTDVHPDSWLLTPEIARAAIMKNSEIRLIIPVATFGIPVDVDGWDTFTEETGIPVVIDAAGAFGNQRIGKKFHLVFSLHATKALGGGEGGFIVTRDPQLARKIKILSNFGIETAEGGNIFTPGTNAKLSEYHAAVSLASLDRWDQSRQKRVNLLQNWLDELTPLIEKNQIITQQKLAQYPNSLLLLRFPNIKNLAELVTHLAEKKIQTKRWYHPLLPHHPAFSSYQCADNILHAEQLTHELLGVPFHLCLNKGEIRYVVETIDKWISQLSTNIFCIQTATNDAEAH